VLQPGLLSGLRLFRSHGGCTASLTAVWP
jgi:hypothetical protein